MQRFPPILIKVPITLVDRFKYRLNVTRLQLDNLCEDTGLFSIRQTWGNKRGASVFVQILRRKNKILDNGLVRNT